MKVNEIKKIIGEKYLSKSRGQILLLNENVARKLANLVGYLEKNRVLEIGPGLGIITKYLLEMGYKVIAVEIDEDFYKYLLGRGIKVINEDFLKLSIDNTLPKFVIGALPFSISLKILLKLKEHREHFNSWIVVVQKEVAERIVSKPNKKSYSSISILFQILYDISIEFNISPKSFFPEPEVTSSAIKANLKENPEIKVTKDFEKFLQNIFRYRRKNLKNNLFDYNIKNVSIPLTQRAESLSIDEIIRLYREILL
jgi:16S rRNA (adenine1518-N6/adenine1519-N6)-dimethyltransferase